MTNTDIENIVDFRRELMKWYDAKKRDLPWRRPGVTSYGIWVSEVMLQQTQVIRVIGYWIKWMDRFPDIQILADADINEVFAHWSGLGYYRRATGLHQGAQYILKHHDGEIPRDHAALLKVPSVGPYIAAAVLSSAFNDPAAAVDANIMRVYARVQRFEKFDLNEGQSRRTIQTVADKAFDKNRCVDWNQAIMDLGAQVCKPREANCASCPLQTFCKAYEWHKSQSGLPDAKSIPQCYPLSRNTILDKRTREVSSVKRSDLRKFAHVASAVVFGARDNVWMNKRPQSGLLANLWDFPTVPIDDLSQKSFKRVAEKSLQLLLRSQNLSVQKGLLYAGSVVHVFSHIRMQVEVFVAQSSAVQVKEEEKLAMDDAQVIEKWVSQKEISTIGISSLAKKILDASHKSKMFCSFAVKKENEKDFADKIIKQEV